MLNSNNMFTGLLSLQEHQLTHSQRKQCMTLFALQEHPFGMLSQLLYSKALNRGNRFSQTIVQQQDEIEQINAINNFLLNENLKMNLVIAQKKRETEDLERLLLQETESVHGEFKELKSSEELLDELNRLEHLNKLLVRSLYQAVFEIQKLITISN